MLHHGDIFLTNRYGKIKVVKRVHSKSVFVEFVDTGYTCETTEDNAKNGRVKDKIMPVIFAVGFIGDGVHRSSSKYYSIWHNMLARCYELPTHEKNRAYWFCRVSAEWCNFQNFAEWCEVNYIDGFELDKDIKVKGNKIYSADTCLFVSQEENKKNKYGIQINNTSGVTGIHLDKSTGKWLVRVSIGKGQRKRIGLFDELSDAKTALKEMITKDNELGRILRSQKP